MEYYWFLRHKPVKQTSVQRMGEHIMYVYIPFEWWFGTYGISSAAPPFLVHHHMLFASDYLEEPRKSE